MTFLLQGCPFLLLSFVRLQSGAAQECDDVATCSSVDLLQRHHEVVSMTTEPDMPDIDMQQVQLCVQTALSPAYLEGKPQKPSLLFIGESHSGTTSLADQMHMHPELSYGLCKEHSFWASTVPLPGRSFSWYSDMEFRVGPKVKHTFDATVEVLYLGDPSAQGGATYFYEKPGISALEHLRSLLGADIRLMMLIRDPVDRLQSIGDVSLHQMGGRNPFTCSADSLESWLQVFPREQFLFLKSEDYFADPAAVLDRVFRFTNVSRFAFAPEQLKHSSGRRRTANHVSLQTRQAFAALPENQDCKARLENLTGLRFSWKYW